MALLRERREKAREKSLVGLPERTSMRQRQPHYRVAGVRENENSGTRKAASMHRGPRDENHALLAARQLGAPLISAEALGMSQAEYQQLVCLQFQEITPEDYSLLLSLDEAVQPPSLNPSQVSMLPLGTIELANGITQFQEDTGPTRPMQHDQCSVCLGPLEVGDQARMLPCTHVFHRDCIDKWLERSTKCPADNLEVFQS
jgi:hypothetical protein